MHISLGGFAWGFEYGLGPYSRPKVQFFPVRRNQSRQMTSLFSCFSRYDVALRAYLCWISNLAYAWVSSTKSDTVAELPDLYLRVTLWREILRLSRLVFGPKCPLCDKNWNVRLKKSWVMRFKSKQQALTKKIENGVICCFVWLCVEYLHFTLFYCATKSLKSC